MHPGRKGGGYHVLHTSCEKGSKEADEWLMKNVPDYAAKKKEEEAREKARREEIAAAGNTRRYVEDLTGHVMEMRSEGVLFLNSDDFSTFFRLLVREEYMTAGMFRERLISQGRAIRLRFGDRLLIEDEIVRIDHHRFRGLVYVAINAAGYKGYIIKEADDRIFWAIVK